MTSADRRARTAASVSSSGSPGPAPTSQTWPKSWPPACASASRRSRSRASGARPPAPSASVANRSQKRRRTAFARLRLLNCRRHACAASTQRAKPAGSKLSMRERTACANTGAAPSVEMATMSGERLTIAPKLKVQKAGRSITLTGTPARRAALARRCASASSAAAPTTSSAPAKFAPSHALAFNTTGPPGGSAARESISGHGAGAHTSTMAPAADSNSAFQAAAALPPAMTTRLPCSLKNSGTLASGDMRGGRAACGVRVSCALMRRLLDGNEAANLWYAAAAIGAGAETLADRLDRAAPGCSRGADALGADLEAHTDDGPLIHRSLHRPAGEQGATLQGRNGGAFKLRLQPIRCGQRRRLADEHDGFEAPLA